MHSYNYRSRSGERGFVGVCNVPICYGDRFEFVHRLPANEIRRQAWLKAINQPKLEHLRCSSMCGRHIRAEDNVYVGAHQLNRVALPNFKLKGLAQLDDSKKDRSSKIKPTREKAVFQENPPSNVISPKDEDRRKRNESQEGTESQNKNEFLTIDDIEISLLGQNESSTVHVPAKHEDTQVTLSVKKEESDKVDVKVETVKQESATVSVLSDSDGDTLDIFIENDINTPSIEIYEENMLVHHLEYDETLLLDFITLRDACKCTQCYDPTTRSRIIRDDSTSMHAMSLQVNAAALSEDVLEVEWNDKHKSSYPIIDLITSSYFPQRSSLIIDRIPWTSELVKSFENFKTFTFKDIICDDDLLKNALGRLKCFGVLVLSEVSDSVQQKPLMMELLLRRILPYVNHRWSKEKRTQFHARQQLPHTNCTFLSESCGLQMLSLSSDSPLERIELIISDGLIVAQELRENSAELFNFCSETKIPLIYRSPENIEYITHVPIIQLIEDDDDDSEIDFDNYIERIQFSPYHRGDMSRRNLLNYHRAYDEIASIIKKDKFHYKLTLERNDLIVLDNWRILWNINFTLHEKHTQDIALDCIYVEHKHFLSRLKHLQIN